MGRMPARFVLLGDVHVRTNGAVPAPFLQLLAALPSLAPDFVLLVGDATSGNRDDGYRASTVRKWWTAYRGALQPLRDASIPVLPIAGNHDYYTEAQRAGYGEAWAALSDEVAPIALDGAPPFYYSFDRGDLHVSMVHVVDQVIGNKVAAWLRNDLRKAQGAALRLAVGHVPIESVMGRTSTSYRATLGGLLLDGGVSIYFAGHEHLVWDAPVVVGARTLRQVIVGTPGASYTMEMRSAVRSAWCKGAVCTLPSTGATFARVPGTGQQLHRVTCILVETDGADATVQPLMLDGSGALVPFA